MLRWGRKDCEGKWGESATKRCWSLEVSVVKREQEGGGRESREDVGKFPNTVRNEGGAAWYHVGVARGVERDVKMSERVGTRGVCG